MPQQRAIVVALEDLLTHRHAPSAVHAVRAKDMRPGAIRQGPSQHVGQQYLKLAAPSAGGSADVRLPCLLFRMFSSITTVRVHISATLMVVVMFATSPSHCCLPGEKYHWTI